MNKRDIKQSTNIALESFQQEWIWRPKKTKSASAIAKYSGHPKSFWVAAKSQTIFFTPIINHCRSFKEGLETLTSFTFTNNNCHSLKEGLKILFTSTLTNNHYRSLKERLEILTSSTPTNNYCYSINEGLET